MTAQHTALVVEVAKLEQIQLELAHIAVRTDEGRRRDLVQQRRLLSTQTQRVSDLAVPLLQAVPDELLTFRRLYSDMRSALAMHQAQWPAVRLGEDDAAYQRSAQTARAANRALIAWLKTTIAALEESK